MVLSYYIATQTVEEHLRFLIHYWFFFFFQSVVFLFFLKNKMQHIPVVSHALWRGTFYFENAGRGPYYTNNWLIPSTGLEFIYSGKEPHRTREWRGEVRWWVERLRFPIGFNGGAYFKGLSSGVSSLTGTAVLGSVDLYLGQCIRESLGGEQVNSGSSVHSVGRAKGVPHPLDWSNGTTTICLPLITTPSTPPDAACKLPFVMQLYLARSLTDRWTAKKRLHFLYKQFLYVIESLSLKLKEKNVNVSHQ